MSSRNTNEDVPVDVPLAVVTRSGQEESWHRGIVVVMEHDKVVRSFGDGSVPVYCRSATKPLQALPLLELDGGRVPDLSPEELAVMVASHDGTDLHLQAVSRILARAGFSQADLQCGPHAPFDREASLALARSGNRPGRLHNNCSGKHAGFLHLAAALGVAPARYLDPDSASQQRVHQVVSDMAGLPTTEVDIGMDGCGAPTFRMPLSALATAFARLANPEDLGPVRARACRTLLDAISTAPEHLAGRNRLCTKLVQSAPGAIFPKNGAEGVYAFGLVGRNLGVAIKITDGHERGYLPVVVDLLHHLDLWSQVPDAMRDFLDMPVRNTQKLTVGHVESLLPW